MVWVTRLKTQQPLNGSIIYRSDVEPLRISVSETNQVDATLKLICKLEEGGAPYIIKSGADFVIVVSTSGNLLVADVTLNTNDTRSLGIETKLLYEVERTIGTDITTLERGSFTVKPDLVVN